MEIESGSEIVNLGMIITDISIYRLIQYLNSLNMLIDKLTLIKYLLVKIKARISFFQENQ